MDNVTSEIRTGTIDDSEVTYSITAKLNGGHVCAAKGTFHATENFNHDFSGVAKYLFDTQTKNKYSILVVPEQFSFINGFTHVKDLL